MKVAAVIPARYASTRFPAKPLAKILGREMLAWTIEGVRKSQKIDTCIVATDHPEIANLARREGAGVVMTSPDIATGTDRVWEAVAQENYDIVVNVQGDEPLISGQVIDSLVAACLNPEIAMATVGLAIRSREELESKNVVKVITNQFSDAIYFSRFAIPMSRSENYLRMPLKHMGIYAFRWHFLRDFCQTPVTWLEQQESLEQLRALYLGAKIRVVALETDAWGVDVPEDIGVIEEKLRQRGFTSKG